MWLASILVPKFGVCRHLFNTSDHAPSVYRVACPALCWDVEDASSQVLFFEAAAARSATSLVSGFQRTPYLAGNVISNCRYVSSRCSVPAGDASGRG